MICISIAASNVCLTLSRVTGMCVKRYIGKQGGMLCRKFSVLAQIFRSRVDPERQKGGKDGACAYLKQLIVTRETI